MRAEVQQPREVTLLVALCWSHSLQREGIGEVEDHAWGSVSRSVGCFVRVMPPTKLISPLLFLSRAQSWMYQT